MAKSIRIVWPLESHTRAKHELLIRYLSRWVPIFQQGRARSPHLVFIDGFAGPGVYQDGEAGSPVLMVRTYLKARPQPETTLHCFFVEDNEKRCEELERRVAGFRNDRCQIHVLHGDYADHYTSIMAQVDGLENAATFAFLDPFSAVGDPDLAVNVVVRPRSEALVYLPVGHFARFLDQPKMAHTLNGVFGDDRWTVLQGKSTARITQGLVKLYAQRLAETTATDRGRFYVEHFAIQPERGERYYLFFATKHRKAVEAMREAMWHVDPANGSVFDPKVRAQRGFETWKPELADALHARFPKGSTFDFEDAWAWVVDNHPPFDKKRLRASLVHLREEGKLEILDPRTRKPSKRGFPPDRPIRTIA